MAENASSFNFISYTHSTAASASCPSSSDFQEIIGIALNKYTKRTNKEHPLTAQLQMCDSPDSLLTVLQKQVQELDQAWGSDKQWTDWIFDSAVRGLVAFATALGVAGLVRLRSYAYLICTLIIYLTVNSHSFNIGGLG
jgi:hypothetical protein